MSNQVDTVNHPPHYTAGEIECIDAIASATAELTGEEAYCTGAAIKYLWRWRKKGGAENLRKAKWYIDRLLSENESNGNSSEADEEYKARFPNVYIGPRKSGRTTKLLLRANETGIPILVRTHNLKKYTETIAKKMELHNVKVVTLNDLKGNRVDEIMIDEAQLLLEELLRERMIRTRIDSMGITSFNITELKEIPYNDTMDFHYIRTGGDDMKMELTEHYCLDKSCGWKERTHRIRDGIKCPRCSGPVMSERVCNKKAVK